MDIRALILSLRADLCRRFGFDKPEKQQAFLAWLVTGGMQEYAALAEDAGFRTLLQGHEPGAPLSRLQQCVWDARVDVQETFALPEQRAEFMQWFLIHGVGEHGLWPFLSAQEKRDAAFLEGPWQADLLSRAVNELAQEAPMELAQRPFGVNLVGYVYGQLGIGEDVRMAARAMQAAQVPFTMLDFAPGADIPQNDRSMAAHVSTKGPFVFNVFCMTAMEHGRYYAERGAAAQMAGHYNIGYWPWELSRWPDQWQQLVHLVDEVWVSTQHTLDAVAPACAALPKPVPVKLMPMAVELGPIAQLGTRAQVRKHFRLPTKARLFVFTFDLNSSIHRKNPQAVVDAFLRAFPANRWTRDQVGLVIRTGRPRKASAVWNGLKALAQSDDRLHLSEGTLLRPELLAFYQACDVFVSLHRAEGFGRGIAEALQLGLHVVTTGYSGNLDFCQRPEVAGMVDLVRYRLVKVRAGQYPFGAEQVWANADVGHAAQCLQAFVARFPPGAESKPPHSVPPEGWPMFSAAEVGQRYHQRLGEIVAIARPLQSRVSLMKAGSTV
jgi:hypothetical protein